MHSRRFRALKWLVVRSGSTSQLHVLRMIPRAVGSEAVSAGAAVDAAADAGVEASEIAVGVVVADSVIVGVVGLAVAEVSTVAVLETSLARRRHFKTESTRLLDYMLV